MSFLVVLILVDAAVWLVAWRLQKPDPAMAWGWASIDRNLRIVTANLAVIGVNVGVLAVLTILRAFR